MNTNRERYGSRRALRWIAALLLGWAAPVLLAQPSVEVEASTRKAYVNMPVTVGIKIADAQQHDRPEFPELPDCDVSAAGTSTLQSIQTDPATGRLRRQETTTYNFTIVPRKPGTITIPGIPIHVDGRTIVTQPVQIEVRQPPQSQAPSGVTTDGDPEASNLLLAEITCADQHLYVGQTAEFTLTIWVKAAQVNGRELSSSDMVRMITGNFGPFDTQQVTTDHAYRKDADGRESLYYILRLPAEYAIQQTGAIAFDDVIAAIDYPTRFQRDRFFGNLQIVASTPVRVRPTVNVPEARPLPQEGRPANFSGIVGRYQIRTSAAPTNVRVGDPIQLVIDITGSPIETLPAPDLTANAELNENFRIPSETLAGTVSGGTKRFVQTIRAKNADVGWIPAIEFPYFDPEKGEYTVARSERLPVLVTKVDELDAGDLTNITSDSPQTQSSNLETRDGLRGNITAEPELLATIPPVTPTHVLLALLAPFAGFLGLLGLRGILRRGGDESLQRRKGALRAAEKRIAAASSDGLSATDFHGEIAAALCGYLADRRDEPPARFVGAAALEFLKTRGVDANLIQAWADVQRRCEEAAYAGGTEKDAALADAALRCVRQIEGVKL